MAPGPDVVASEGDGPVGSLTWLQAARDRKRLLRALIAEQGGRCHWCGWTMRVGTNARKRRDRRLATFDHLVPLARGGTDARANLCAACAGCNHDRGDRTVEEWLGEAERRRRAEP